MRNGSQLRRLTGGVATAHGVTTLTMAPGGPEAVIVLDYGRDVGGIPFLDVTSVTGAPTLRASFSESQRYIGPDGDNGGLGPCCGNVPPAAEANRWVEPGYATWSVASQPGDLRWAAGRTPTAHGPIAVDWRRSLAGHRFDFDVTAPGSRSRSPAGLAGTGSRSSSSKEEESA